MLGTGTAPALRRAESRRVGLLYTFSRERIEHLARIALRTRWPRASSCGDNPIASVSSAYQWIEPTHAAGALNKLRASPVSASNHVNTWEADGRSNKDARSNSRTEVATTHCFGCCCIQQLGTQRRGNQANCVNKTSKAGGYLTLYTAKATLFTHP